MDYKISNSFVAVTVREDSRLFEMIKDIAEEMWVSNTFVKLWFASRAEVRDAVAQAICGVVVQYLCNEMNDLSAQGEKENEE